MQEPDDDEREGELAFDDFCEGLRTGCGARAARGLRRMGILEGSSLSYLLGMFRADEGMYSIYRLELEKRKNTQKPASLIAHDRSAFAKSLVAGDAEAASQYLAATMNVEKEDIELLAELLEGDSHPYPYFLHLVQRRAGPSIDELAMKAKWFMIYRTYNKIVKPGMQAKMAVSLVHDYFGGRIGYGKSTIYEALRYFRRFRQQRGDSK